MQLEVTPPLGEPETDALRIALAVAGVSFDERPPAYDSPWRRAAAREAVDDELDLDASGALAPQHPRRDAGVVEP